MWCVLRWIAKVAVVVVKWATASLIRTVVLGLSARLVGRWLDKQSWAGARLLGDLVSGFGTGFLVAGSGGFLVGKLIAAGPRKVVKSTATYLTFGASDYLRDLLY